MPKDRQNYETRIRKYRSHETWGMFSSNWIKCQESLEMSGSVCIPQIWCFEVTCSAYDLRCTPVQSPPIIFRSKNWGLDARSKARTSTVRKVERTTEVRARTTLIKVRLVFNLGVISSPETIVQTRAQATDFAVESNHGFLTHPFVPW